MKKSLFLATSLLLTSLLAGCGCNTNSSKSNGNDDSQTVDVVTPDDDMFGDADKKIIDSVDTVITLSDSGADISGSTSGASYSSNLVTISSPGHYEITGSSNSVTILVNDSSKKGNIYLLLNGVSIASSSKACILIISADKVLIQPKEGTINNLTSTFTSSYSYGSTNVDATVYSRDTVTFSGNGDLTVTGQLKAVESKDDMRIYGDGGFIFTSNKDKCLNTDDSVRIGGNPGVYVNGNEDGIHVENSSGDSFFYMESGTLTISASYDGIDVSTEATTFSGYTKLVAGTINIVTTSTSSSTSRKGIKCLGDIYVGKMDITINSKDDGFHSGASISFTDGTYDISSGDDAIHADNTFHMSGGTAVVNKASEGVESNHVDIVGGSLTIYSSDDGINASKKIDESPTIKVTGGYLDITVGSGDVDGIDSNGTFTQTGGVIITRGAPNSTGGTATGIDTDSGINLSGGTFICVGPYEGTLTKNSGVYGFGLGTTTGGPGGGPGGPKRTSSITLTSGTWTVSGIDISFAITGNYYGISVYSSDFSSGSTYTVSSGSSSYLGTAS